MAFIQKARGVEFSYVPREVRGRPSTERVRRLYWELLSSEPRIDSERAVLYTEYVKAHWSDPPYTRQGGALKYVLSHLTPQIRDGELIVGSTSRFVRGAQLYPEYEVAWIVEALRGVKRAEEKYVEGALVETAGERIGIYRVAPGDRERIEEVVKFWEGKDWRSQAYRVLRERDDFELVEKMQEQLVFLRFMWDAPEGRVIVNYGKVLEEGLQSIIEKIRRRLVELQSARTKEDLERRDFYNGLVLALEGVIEFAENYARKAEELAEKCSDDARRRELLEIARICRKVPRYPAETFHEAVQSFWFIHCALFIEANGRGISPGRFDQYMYKYYKRDVEAGRITEEEALELLELLRIKCSEIVRAHAKFTESYLGGSLYQNLTIGGCDEHGRPADNELSMLILQAGINVPTPQPTISVRWNEGLSEEFKLKVVECIKAGAGYPALFNDEVGIRRLLEATGATLEDARDWAPCGCVDVQICGRRMPMYAVPNTNNVKILELVLNNGVNPATGDRLINTGVDVEEASFEELVEAYRMALDLVVRKEAEYWNVAMLTKIKMGLVPLLMSALLEDCVEKGKSCDEGGCRYNDSAYLISCGMINVANSLAAIKKCVFEEGLFTMRELREALKRNFEGYEHVRRRLLNAPKYGNDDPYVDEVAAELYDTWSRTVQEYKNWLGQPYRPSTLSVTSQVVLGKACGATPDGRRAGEPLADGSCSAYPGTDVKGPTALLKSATRINALNLQSTLLNMKLNPMAVAGYAGSKKLISLIEAYFKLGGYHIQFNIVDSNMLRDAQRHPERYPDLMIRVAGFTARFVELGRDVQDEIIRRTEYQEVWA
ncbi:MAG: hypothetical protein N3H31_05315 [Candidatus Nezhaarchaeota archaeon]|nr:hypothetical protein [Candidatus Nezhaarchaeota archaeon]